jgi:hypothetical protein
MIGTTRSRVSFFMNKFRKLGFRRLSNNSQFHPEPCSYTGGYQSSAIAVRGVSGPSSIDDTDNILETTASQKCCAALKVSYDLLQRAKRHVLQVYLRVVATMVLQ